MCRVWNADKRHRWLPPPPLLQRAICDLSAPNLARIQTDAETQQCNVAEIDEHGWLYSMAAGHY